jgi:hypothetical protein
MGDGAVTFEARWECVSAALALAHHLAPACPPRRGPARSRERESQSKSISEREAHLTAPLGRGLRRLTRVRCESVAQLAQHASRVRRRNDVDRVCAAEQGRADSLLAFAAPPDGLAGRLPPQPSKPTGGLRHTRPTNIIPATHHASRIARVPHPISPRFTQAGKQAAFPPPGIPPVTPTPRLPAARKAPCRHPQALSAPPKATRHHRPHPFQEAKKRLVALTRPFSGAEKRLVAVARPFL